MYIMIYLIGIIQAFSPVIKDIDYKQVECLAQNIYFESKSEPIKGQYAVAKVTMNRVESDQFPDTICGVVKQRRRNVCQFSWWCSPKTLNTVKTNSFNKKLYNQAKLVALDVYLRNSQIDVGLDGALFYHATYIKKNKLGVAALEQTKKIGKHIFYKLSES